MLAEKLLAKDDYDCDKEIRTLELLKIRFGDSNLLNCEASPCRKACQHTVMHTALLPVQSRRPSRTGISKRSVMKATVKHCSSRMTSHEQIAA